MARPPARAQTAVERMTLLAVLVAAILGAFGGSSLAGSTQTMVFQDDGSFQEPAYALNGWCPSGDPVCNLNLVDNNGARAVRILIYWKKAAPSPDSCTRPSVDLSSIASYDPGYVSRIAAEINAASQRAMGIYLAFSAPFPCWASLRPSLCASADCSREPDPALYAQFVNAFASRFGYVASRWSPYNEPDHPAFLTPQTSDAYTALMYRHLWYVGRAEIRKYSNAPIWFGETSKAGATAASAQQVRQFINNALCRGGTSEVSQDPANYPSCSGVGPAPPAEAISFHFYGGAGMNPQTNLTALNTMSGILIENQQAGTFPRPGYIVQTEHAWKVGGTDGVSADLQAKYIACDEENAYKNGQLVATSQYGFQDPPPGRGGDLHTGLITQSVNGGHGVARPSLYSWIMPFTVYRRADGRLEVWGAIRADYMPKNYVTVRGWKNGVLRYSRNITLAASGYYHALLTDAPTGLIWNAVTSSGGYTTRTATGTDCGTGWTGGNPAY